jgi:hypothetical protein
MIKTASDAHLLTTKGNYCALCKKVHDYWSTVRGIYMHKPKINNSDTELSNFSLVIQFIIRVTIEWGKQNSFSQSN